MARIIEGDNFGGETVDEVFLNLPSMSENTCEKLVKIINDALNWHGDYPRYYKVVADDYEPYEFHP